MFFNLKGKGNAVKNNSRDAIWNYPENEEDVNRIFLKEDGGKIRSVYKHSRTCGICMLALREVEKILEPLQNEVDFYFIDVRKDRPLSQKIASMTGVRHESPQFLIMKDGEVLWHASHHEIREKELLEAFRNLTT